MSLKKLSILAILTGSLLLAGSGCRSTRPDAQRVYLLDGLHVTSYKVGDHINMDVPALPGVKHAFVVTDVGLKLMYGLDVVPPEVD